MYSNTGYLYDADIETEDLAHSLTVLSCGIYRLSHQPVMPTLRPKGRKDYQLLYIFSGKAYFTFHSFSKK